MKFSEAWLREWVSPALDTRALADQLTMAGLEVDAIEPVAGQFSGVVVGEIAAIAPHPDADKLRVCQVSDGVATVQVVCGAANARQGLKVPFARVGAVLPAITIKQAKLRGVESHGMLCGADELGLAEHSDGLLELPAEAVPGADLRAWLQLDDSAIELGLTPNRADCLGIAGIAREVGALNGCTVAAPVIAPLAPQIDDTLPVEIAAGADCPRYVGRVIRAIDPGRASPTWLTEKLRRCGLRSIDPVVDVTNYVMLELGQPMHAFDLERLQGGIRVRHAVAGEQLETLDGQTLTLRDGSLVIADHQRPLALAGVMGGRASAVSSDTRHLFLESAFFTPQRLAGAARSYGLHTDSSHRFERGVDPELQRLAIERATGLIVAIVGGHPGPLVEVAQAEHLPQREPIALRRASIARLLGITLPDERVVEILTGLGMGVQATDDGWRVVPPSWRFDIAIEADLLEELARVHGYNNLPVQSIRAELPLLPKTEANQPLGVIRRTLIARGYQEAVTYSFVDPRMQALLAPDAVVVPLRNPISSEMSVMRTTLWTGLLGAARHNLNRQQPRVRLFETGLRFLPGADGLQQTPALALLATGRRHPEGWAHAGEAVDFFDLKGEVEALLALCRVDTGITFERCDLAALHPGQAAVVKREGRVIGHVGALHPELQRQLDLPQPVYLAELALAELTGGGLPRFTELSRFPEVRRDLALLVDRDLAAAELLAAVRGAAGESLRDLTLFDVYQGKGIDPKRKSLALGLTFQHSSRTLTEDEINAAIAAVMQILTARFGATLRN